MKIIRIKTIFSIVSVCLFQMLLSDCYAAATAKDQKIDALTDKVLLLKDELSSVEEELDQVAHEKEKKEAHQGAPKKQLTAKKGNGKKSDLSDQKQFDQSSEVFEKGYSALHEISKLNIGMPVFTSPYIQGINPRYDISNLIINVSNINRDKNLLLRRRRIIIVLLEQGLLQPKLPVMSFSGEVKGGGGIENPYRGATKSDIDLKDVKLDGLVSINSWALAFFTFAYDRSPTATGARIGNSRLFIENAFLTIGNFYRAPFYGTIGQMTVPFGRYHSSMISEPLTEAIGETGERALVFGYQHDNQGPYLTVYAARGESYPHGHNQQVNQWGGDTGYLYHHDDLDIEVGGSIIGNMADAAGMQSTGGVFPGFAMTSEKLRRVVPGVDFYGFLKKGNYLFIAEFDTPLIPFSPKNLSFNNSGAKPQAVHVEGSYNFNLFGHSSAISTSFGQSFEALALNIPKCRYMLVLSGEILQNIVLSAEYRHDVNYKKSDTATGQGQIAFNPSRLGHQSNSVIAQVVAYF